MFLTPLFFASIGTWIVICSILINGPLVQTFENKISDIELDISEDNKFLESAASSIQKSYDRYLPAEIKLVILQTSVNSENQAQILLDIAKSILQGILERHIAAKGVGLSQEEFKEIEKIALAAGRGDQKSFERLSKISEDLISEWAERHNELVEKRNKKKIELDELKHKSNFYRNISIALQVVGLIFVLLKDSLSINFS